MKLSPEVAGPASAPSFNRSFILVAAVFLLLAIRLFWYVNHYAVNLFFLDQWDFYNSVLFEDHSLWEIFRWQHGPHREGIGMLLALLVDPLFHWSTRAQAFVATSLIVAAAICALFLKYRLAGKFEWTDVVIPIIMLKPDRRDALWETVNYCHSLVPLLIMLFCLAWTVRNERVKFALVVVFDFLVTYSGYGFFIGLMTPVLLIATYLTGRDRASTERKWLAGCIVASFLSLASFFYSYLHQTAAQCDSLWSAPVLRYFWFVDLLYATTMGTRSIARFAKGIGMVVFVLVALVAAVGWWRAFRQSEKVRGLHLAAMILTAYSICFCLFAALGRTCMGLDTAVASRHINYVQLGILGLYLGALAVRRPVWRWWLPALLVIALLPSLRVPPSDESVMEYHRAVMSAWRTCYLGGGSIAQCDKRTNPIYPWPEATHLEEKLEFLRSTGQNLFSDSDAF